MQNLQSESQTSALEMQNQLQSSREEASYLQQSKDQLLLEAEGWNEKYAQLLSLLLELSQY